jgi:hypothetical protein
MQCSWLYLYIRGLGLDIDKEGVGLAEAMKMAASSPKSALTNGRFVFRTLHAYRLLDVRWQFCAHTIIGYSFIRDAPMAE